jgi:threonine/homoserine/homoserine lactone efflux protein
MHVRFSSFVSGLLIALGDPKAILFYMGLLPAFMDLSNVTIVDTVFIMTAATGVIVSVMASYAYRAGSAERLFVLARNWQGRA